MIKRGALRPDEFGAKNERGFVQKTLCETMVASPKLAAIVSLAFGSTYWLVLGASEIGRVTAVWRGPNVFGRGKRHPPSQFGKSEI